MQNPEPTPPQSPLRLLLFLIVTLVLGALLMALPSPFQRILIFVIIFAALTVVIQHLLILIYHTITRTKILINPNRHIYLNFAIAIGLIGLSTYFYQRQYIDVYTGFYFFLLSLPFVWWSLSYLPSSSIPADTDNPQSSQFRWWLLVVSVISMVLLAMMNIPQLWIGQIHRTLGIVRASASLQMLAFGVGIMAWLLGFGVRLIPRRIQLQRHHLILGGIIILAAFTRFWDLEHAIRMFVDEFLFIRGVVAIEQNDIQILVPNANAFSDVFSYFQFLVKQVIGPGLSALRIPSAIFGVLGVVGIYALARQLFSLRIALLSALLLAVMPVHIHFSRIGLNNIAGSVIGIWFFVYVLRGMRHQRLSDFAMSGVLLGLTHYFYEGERLFFTPFFICWVGWIFIFCKPSSTLKRLKIKQLAVITISCLVMVAPFYHSLASNDRRLAERLVVTRDPELTVESHVANTLLYSHPADIGRPIARYVQWSANDIFYQSLDAFVLPMLIPFFLIGFAYLLWHIRSYGGSLIIWWAIGVAIANSFIMDWYSASSPRHVLVYGILTIISAIGISTVWSLAAHYIGTRLKNVIYLGFGLFLLGTASYSSHYYFNDSAPRFQEHIFKSGTANDDMMLRALALPDNTDVHVFTDLPLPGSLGTEVIYYYERDPDEFALYQWLVQRLHDEYFLELPRDRDYVFVLHRRHDFIVDDIKRFFTITKIEGSPWENVPPDAEMIFYFAPMEANQTLPNGLPLPDMPINPRYR